MINLKETESSIEVKPKLIKRNRYVNLQPVVEDNNGSTLEVTRTCLSYSFYYFESSCSCQSLGGSSLELNMPETIIISHQTTAQHEKPLKSKNKFSFLL